MVAQSRSAWALHGRPPGRAVDFYWERRFSARKPPNSSRPRPPFAQLSAARKPTLAPRLPFSLDLCADLEAALLLLAWLDLFTCLSLRLVLCLAIAISCRTRCAVHLPLRVHPSHAISFLRSRRPFGDPLIPLRRSLFSSFRDLCSSTLAGQSPRSPPALSHNNQFQVPAFSGYSPVPLFSDVVLLIQFGRSRIIWWNIFVLYSISVLRRGALAQQYYICYSFWSNTFFPRRIFLIWMLEDLDTILNCDFIY